MIVRSTKTASQSRQDIHNNESVIYLNEKEETSTKCFICYRTYPKEMEIQEINSHVNYCVEGKENLIVEAIWIIYNFWQKKK